MDSKLFKVQTNVENTRALTQREIARVAREIKRTLIRLCRIRMARRNTTNDCAYIQVTVMLSRAT